MTDDRRQRQHVYQSGLWRPLRDAYLMAHPLCEDCQAAGRVRVATEVHHVVSFMLMPEGPLRDELAYDAGNLVALCGECHRARHRGAPRAVSNKKCQNNGKNQL